MFVGLLLVGCCFIAYVVFRGFCCLVSDCVCVSLLFCSVLVWVGFACVDCFVAWLGVIRLFVLCWCFMLLILCLCFCFVCMVCNSVAFLFVCVIFCLLVGCLVCLCLLFDDCFGWLLAVVMVVVVCCYGLFWLLVVRVLWVLLLILWLWVTLGFWCCLLLDLFWWGVDLLVEFNSVAWLYFHYLGFVLWISCLFVCSVYVCFGCL